jgi:hypothetical protein
MRNRHGADSPQDVKLVPSSIPKDVLDLVVGVGRAPTVVVNKGLCVSVPGTFLPCQARRAMSAIEGRPANGPCAIYLPIRTLFLLP